MLVVIDTLALFAQENDSKPIAAASPKQTGRIVATADAQVPALRLQSLISKDAQLDFPIVGPDVRGDTTDLEFVLCTRITSGQVESRLRITDLKIDVKRNGFWMASDSNNRQVVVVGDDSDSLRYGVGELWHYRCALNGNRITPTIFQPIAKAPAFAKRVFWNWTHCTNWDDELARVHQTKHVDTDGTLEPHLAQPNGFTETFQKVIDFQADHKLNGLIVWGFLNDAHGGLDSAQSVSKYAMKNGVKILPGIGTIGYGGFYFGGNHPYNIYTFLAANPQVRLMTQADGKTMPGTPCPSDPKFQQWLRDASEWYFSTLKDIGGVNLEHGDFFHCHCSHCAEARRSGENDDNYYWDMMTTQVPVIEAGLRINPRIWYTYASYDGYDVETSNKPPKFLRQYPQEAVTQWTYTKMIVDPILNPKGAWPSSLRPPVGTNHSIGLLHQGSHWDVKRQWWGESAKSEVAFGGTYSLVADLIQNACRRAIDDDSEGLQIVGQIGIASPQNELNYLALEAFTWDTKLDFQTWIDRDLAPLYGGPALSRRFYEIVSDPTTEPSRIASDLSEAERTLETLTDPRQSKRWSNLTAELRRRLLLLRVPHGR